MLSDALKPTGLTAFAQACKATKQAASEALAVLRPEREELLELLDRCGYTTAADAQRRRGGGGAQPACS